MCAYAYCDFDKIGQKRKLIKQYFEDTFIFFIHYSGSYNAEAATHFYQTATTESVCVCVCTVDQSLKGTWLLQIQITKFKYKNK